MTSPLFKWGVDPKAYTDPSDYEPSTLLAPAVKIVLLSTSEPFDPPKKIIGDKAGTATVTDASGNEITGFPITGAEQSVAITAISSLSTTTKVWGLY